MFALTFVQDPSDGRPNTLVTVRETSVIPSIRAQALLGQTLLDELEMKVKMVQIGRGP